MPFKLLISALSLCVFSLCISSAFGATLVKNAPAAAGQQINKRMDYLQVQINELRAKQRDQKKQKKKKTTSRMTICYQKKECNGRQCQQQYHTSPLGIGPYLNKDAVFDGSKLIINVPIVREDSRLLLKRYQLIQECHELGILTPNLPRVTLTGKLEGQISYDGTSYYDAGSRSGNNINFSGAELDAYIQGNSWVLGYMALALDYVPDEHRDGSRLFMNRAFITIGNLSQFPLYTSIGQVYVPFGRYSSLMVTAPVTQALGRTKARTLILGYQQTDNNNNVLHAEIYGFQGLSNNNLNNRARDNKKNEWGTDIGYEFNNGHRLSGEIGAGYISSLVDSQGIKATVFLNTENLRHCVPALNVYGILAINPVMFLAEYVGTMRSFDVNDISFTNQEGARRCPTAFHTEASYTFKNGSKPSSIGVGYGHTRQALAIGLPKDQYSVFYNINIWRDTNLALEYRHDVNYPANTISTGSNPISDVIAPANVVDDFGKSDDVVTAQFDLFF